MPIMDQRHRVARGSPESGLAATPMGESLPQVRERREGSTGNLTTDFKSCLGGRGGLAAVDEGGGNFLLIGVKLGVRRVKNERTTV
jgi:hypothetical protein